MFLQVLSRYVVRSGLKSSHTPELFLQLGLYQNKEYLIVVKNMQALKVVVTKPEHHVAAEMCYFVTLKRM